MKGLVDKKIVFPTPHDGYYNSKLAQDKDLDSRAQESHARFIGPLLWTPHSMSKGPVRLSSLSQMAQGTL